MQTQLLSTTKQRSWPFQIILSSSIVTCDSYSFLAVCGDTFTTPTGQLNSPNYPNYYINNYQCYWRITVPKGPVQLHFHYFETYHSSDYLRVSYIISVNLFIIKRNGASRGLHGLGGGGGNLE